ncbi:MAG: amidohydrolase [Pseudomonadota bacterium]|nr:MAG: amidohydrolase [Pseudomonadota bacterium]
MAAAEPIPICDGHIHFNAQVREHLHPTDALRRLDEAGITCAIVSSTPNDGTERLHALAPDRIVPMLRPYRTAEDRYTWFRDPATIEYLRHGLAHFDYRGIGEFHVFGAQAETPVVREMVRIAVSRQMPLHAHTNVTGITSLLEQATSVPVIWAHAGFDTPVAELHALLDAHDNLYLELSFREGIAPDGRLAPAWRELFIAHRRRCLVGTDTYIPSRWTELSALADAARAWLTQLPPGVATDIAHANAQRVFARGGNAGAAP